jgi:hypothetical protein
VPRCENSPGAAFFDMMLSICLSTVGLFVRVDLTTKDAVGTSVARPDGTANRFLAGVGEMAVCRSNPLKTSYGFSWKPKLRRWRSVRRPMRTSAFGGVIGD